MFSERALLWLGVDMLAADFSPPPPPPPTWICMNLLYCQKISSSSRISLQLSARCRIFSISYELSRQQKISLANMQKIIPSIAKNFPAVAENKCQRILFRRRRRGPEKIAPPPPKDLSANMSGCGHSFLNCCSL